MSYRFKVTFFYNKGAEEIESLSYYVKSVELPVWNISTENRLRFGNTQYVIPTFDFGQSTLKIVFMETDNMSISYFLNGFLFNNIENTDMEMNLWNNCAPGILKIKIDELEPSMRGTVISNIYACHLKRLSTPKFGNTSLGTPVEIEAEFVVRYKLNSITTEIGAEPREIKDPDSLRKDILEARQQEEKIKEDIIGINAKMQALAFADVEAKKKQKKDLETKKKGLEAMLAQKEKERAELEAKINKNGADITALLAKKKQLEAMLALRNKTRKQAGLNPIYGFTEEESAINGFLDQEYINNNVTDAMGIVSIDASILSENGKVDVDELMAKLNQYGIKYNVSRHGDTFENLAAFSSLFSDKELGTIEYISMSKADYEKFDGLSTTDILNVLSDIQSIDQQLAQHEKRSQELKQDLKDLESLNNDISSLKSDIAKTDSDISGVDAELREMSDTNIYSASESKGENVDKSYQGTGGQSPGEKVTAVMSEGRKNKSTTDFVVTDSEADALYDKYVKDQKKNNKEVASKSEYRNMLEKNAQKMDKALTEFKSILKAEGIGVWVEAYNDAGHAVGTGESSSHTMGQKVDINFIDLSGGGSKGTKIVGGKNMTEEQLQKILGAAKKAGLVPNWETNKGKYGPDSGWGDFALADAWTTKNGKVYYKEGFTSWTGVRSNADESRDFERSDMVTGAKKTKAESKKEQLGR